MFSRLVSALFRSARFPEFRELSILGFFPECQVRRSPGTKLDWQSWTGNARPHVCDADLVQRGQRRVDETGTTSCPAVSRSEQARLAVRRLAFSSRHRRTTSSPGKVSHRASGAHLATLQGHHDGRRNLFSHSCDAVDLGKVFSKKISPSGSHESRD